MNSSFFQLLPIIFIYTIKISHGIIFNYGVQKMPQTNESDATSWIERFKKVTPISPRFTTVWKEAEGIYMIDLEVQFHLCFSYV